MRSFAFLLVAVLAGCSEAGVTKFNANPTPVITSHVDGDTAREGVVENLMGQVGDTDHESAELSVIWTVGGEPVCPESSPDADGSVGCDTSFDVGGGSVVLSVRDPAGAGASDSIELDVQPTDAPEVNITAPTTIGKYYADQTITFQGTVSDTEDAADALTVTLETDELGDLGLDIDVTSEGEVEAFGLLPEGEHAVRLQAIDTSDKEGNDSVVITVGPANSAPTCAITAPEDGSAGADGEEVRFEGMVADVDVSPSEIAVSWESDIDGPLRETTPDSDGSVGFATSELTANTHRITLSATDELGEPCTTSIYFTVGTPPVVIITNPAEGDTVGANDTMTFTAAVSDEEDLSTELSLQWAVDEVVFSDEGADSSGEASFEWPASTWESGDHTLEVTVTDTDGLYVSESVNFSINAPPNTPAVIINPDPALTTDNLFAVATGSEDPDGSGVVTYRYAWFADGLEVVDVTGAEYPAATTAKHHTYRVEVFASDGLHDSDPATAERTVSNSDPTITDIDIAPDEATAGTTVACEASATDVDGDTVTFTYLWSDDTSGPTAVIADDALTGSTLTCTATASDGDGGTDTATASITVTNTAPVMESVTITPSTGQVGDTLTCEASASDADGDALTTIYAWSDGSTGSTYVIVAADEPGDTITCTATTSDPSGATTSGTATATVVNTEPILGVVSITPEEPDNDDTLTCAASASDADGESPSISYTWSTGEDGPTTTLTSSSMPGDVITCTATATDASGASDSDSASVTVQNRGPSIGSVSITPDSPRASDALTCTASDVSDPDGGAVEITYVWDIDGEDAGSGTSLSGGYAKGDAVTCSVTATDETADSTTASATVTIGNTRPNVSDIDLSPSELFTNDTLTAVPTVSDADGDDLTVTYAFSVDGEVVQDGESASLSGADHFDKHDSVSVVVTADDGEGFDTRSSDTITVQNTPPTAPVVSLGSDPCDEGWTVLSDGARCAAVFSGPDHTWLDAEESCNDMGGHLARTDSAADNDILYDLAADLPDESMWIGYNDRDSEGSWAWSDGGPTAYENWRAGEPGGGGGLDEDCAALLHSTATPSYEGKWVDEHCESAGWVGGYACQVPVDVPSCPDGWTSMDDEMRCVHVFESTSHTWTSAEAACDDMGADLVSVLSETDKNQVFDLATGLEQQSIWIGFNDIASEDDWVWSGGDPVSYTNWESGEPNGGPSENCAEMYHDGAPAHIHGIWNDLDCEFTDHTGGYACQLNRVSEGLVCTIDEESTDDDGDPITYTFDWDVDGVDFTDTDTTTWDGDTVPDDALASEQTWTCEVTPDDGEEVGELASDSLYIEYTAAELPPTEMSFDVLSVPGTLQDHDVASDGSTRVLSTNGGSVYLHCFDPDGTDTVGAIHLGHQGLDSSLAVYTSRVSKHSLVVWRWRITGLPEEMHYSYLDADCSVLVHDEAVFTNDYMEFFDAAIDDSGRAVITYVTGETNVAWIDSSGEILGTEIPFDIGASYGAHVAMNQSTGAGIVASQIHSGDGIYYQRFDADFNWIDSSPVWMPAGHHYWYDGYTVGMNDNGEFAFLWGSDHYTLSMSFYSADGDRVASVSRPSSTYMYYDIFRRRHPEIPLRGDNFIFGEVYHYGTGAGTNVTHFEYTPNGDLVSEDNTTHSLPEGLTIRTDGWGNAVVRDASTVMALYDYP